MRMEYDGCRGLFDAGTRFRPRRHHHGNLSVMASILNNCVLVLCNCLQELTTDSVVEVAYLM